MPHLNQRGAILPVLMLLLLVGGVGLGTYLIQQKTNLFPKASEKRVEASGIVYVDTNLNKEYDVGEEGVEGAIIVFAGGIQFPRAVSGKDGRYSGASTDDSCCRLTLLQPDGFTFSSSRYVFTNSRTSEYNFGIIPATPSLVLDSVIEYGCRDKYPVVRTNFTANNVNSEKFQIWRKIEGGNWTLANEGIYVVDDRIDKDAYNKKATYFIRVVSPRLGNIDSNQLDFTIQDCSKEPFPTPLPESFGITNLKQLSCNGKYPQIQVSFNSYYFRKYEIWRKVEGITDWQVAKEVYKYGTYTDERIDSNSYGKTAQYFIRGTGNSWYYDDRRDSSIKEITIPNCGSTTNPVPTPTPTPSSSSTPQPSASATGTGTLTVKGTVYRDFNGNGVLDSGDKEYADSPVYLHNPDGSQVLAQFRTTGGGNFAFYNLAPGSYRITHYVPPGYSKTTDDSFSFDLSSDKTVYFGIKPN